MNVGARSMHQLQNETTSAIGLWLAKRLSYVWIRLDRVMPPLEELQELRDSYMKGVLADNKRDTCQGPREFSCWSARKSEQTARGCLSSGLGSCLCMHICAYLYDQSWMLSVVRSYLRK